jgi:hypothetical protein
VYDHFSRANFQNSFSYQTHICNRRAASFPQIEGFFMPDRRNTSGNSLSVDNMSAITAIMSAITCKHMQPYAEVSTENTIPILLQNDIMVLFTVLHLLSTDGDSDYASGMRL